VKVPIPTGYQPLPRQMRCKDLSACGREVFFMAGIARA
jgi:hypothetical protein